MCFKICLLIFFNLGENIMENKNFNNKINVSDDDKKDENDILNQSYEDIYSINENKNAIKKLDLGASSAYQECGQRSRIKVALDKNGNKIGIAIGISDNGKEMTHNCLNYAFLASCGERVPHILSKFEKDDVPEGYISSFEVQKFFPHDVTTSYFTPNCNDSIDIFDIVKEDTKLVVLDKEYLQFRSYFRMWHILAECNGEFKTQFIDHFATLFADELCFDIQDRNKGNILVVPSRDGNKQDIVNIDVDFGWQEKINSACYLRLYCIAKNVTFQFNKKLDANFMNIVNNFLNKKYKPNGDEVNFQFKQGQELKISPEIIAEIDKKIIEKIEQRLNFRKDKFVQYYIDNCIRRGDIDKKVAFSDFQKFMKSLYEYLKKQAESLKINKDFSRFSKPFDVFMKKNKDDQSFNNLSEGDFNKKWDERARVLKNPKKIEEKKVNKGKIENDNRMSLFDNNNIFKKLEEEAIGDPTSIFYKENEKKNENGSINNEDEENEIINNDKKYEKEKIINDNKIENSIIEDKSNKSEKELKDSKEIEEQKVNLQVYPSYPASEQIFTTIEAPIIDINNNDQKKFENEDKSKIKNENKDGTKDNNKTNRTYLMKWLLIILGLLLVSGGIALFLTASALALKFLAIGLGILGAVSLGVGILYNKIIEHYRKESGSCCFRFLTYTIFEPKEKNKENDINLENQENNMIKDK